MRKPRALFELGRLVATPGVLDAVPRGELLSAVGRHLKGDWGEVPDGDARENELALRCGFRIVSAYRRANGTEFFIITEADRSYTTVLLKNEY